MDFSSDIEASKADLIFDSFLLSDFTLFGKNLVDTIELYSIIYGLGLFPCAMFYTMLVGTWKAYFEFLTCSDATIYNDSDEVLALNMLAMFFFLISSFANYNVSFNAIKPGNSCKIKSVILIIGGPIFIITFLYGMIFGQNNLIDMKIVLEITMIFFAFFLISEIEQEH